MPWKWQHLRVFCAIQVTCYIMNKWANPSGSACEWYPRLTGLCIEVSVPHRQCKLHFRNANASGSDSLWFISSSILAHICLCPCVCLLLIPPSLSPSLPPSLSQEARDSPACPRSRPGAALQPSLTPPHTTPHPPSCQGQTGQWRHKRSLLPEESGYELPQRRCESASHCSR